MDALEWMYRRDRIIKLVCLGGEEDGDKCEKVVKGIKRRYRISLT